MTIARAALAAILALAPAAVAAEPRTPVPAAAFLDSLGVNTSLPNRGQTLDGTVDMLRYTGVRWIRAGIEGVDGIDVAERPHAVNVGTFLELHRRAGVRTSWGLLSGGVDLVRLRMTARRLAADGALLAFEGANEPNNWPVTVDGVEGGGRTASWLPVAKLQARLYGMVKADPRLRRYPVWSVSEGGAETDDVGLQWLVVPKGAGAAMPDGTRYADAANLHNYPTGVNARPLPDDVAWSASDPSPAVAADGLFHEYGSTWNHHFKGYGQAALDALPRVSTETGVLVQGPVDERRQGALILDLYLSQFARGYSHTAMYLLRDRTDEAGNQKYGMFRPDYSPRPAATYMHNLTTILASSDARRFGHGLDYAIAGRPGAAHDLLLRLGSGALALIVWEERAAGEDAVAIDFGGPVDARVLDPTRGVEPIARETGASRISLTLSDHPLVVVIEPPLR